MKGYKEPGFQDRTAASARAKDRALAKLKAAPKPDEAELAARANRQREREAAAAAKREAAREAKEAALRLEQQRASEAQAARALAEPPVPTEAERKAARDARYAARKNRKS